MCYDATSRPPLPPIAGGAARGEDLVLTAADGNRFAAYLAVPDQPKRGRVLILPDVRGLYPFYKELADRFAEQGYNALAFDYFGRTAGLSARNDAFEHAPHVQGLERNFEGFAADVAAGLARLRQDGGENSPLFTVGFCLGGSLSLLAGTRDVGLAGVVAFYSGFTRSFAGVGTALEQAGNVRYPVLGLYGGADPAISPEQLETLKQRLGTAGVEHEVVTYPGAPHSFFDRHARQHADASADAWTRMLRFLEGHSG